MKLSSRQQGLFCSETAKIYMLIISVNTQVIGWFVTADSVLPNSTNRFSYQPTIKEHLHTFGFPIFFPFQFARHPSWNYTRFGVVLKELGISNLLFCCFMLISLRCYIKTQVHLSQTSTVYGPA